MLVAIFQLSFSQILAIFWQILPDVVKVDRVLTGCLYVVFSELICRVVCMLYFLNHILIFWLFSYMFTFISCQHPFYLQTWDGPTRRQRRNPIARQRCAAEAENRARVFLLPAPGAQSIFSCSCCPHSRVQPAENASFYLSLFSSH